MGKHTPGPWRQRKNDPSWIEDSSGRTSDASAVCYIDEEKENWGDQWDGDWRANGALVAAAPEMYEVLQNVAKRPEEILEIMRVHGIVMDNLIDDKWQKFAFTLFTMLIKGAEEATDVITKAEGKEAKA